MPVPSKLEFVTTTNPYEDDEGGAPSGAPPAQDTTASYEPSRADRDFAAQLAEAAYPSYATHGLEALSAVASQDQYNYAPPPAPMNPSGSPQPYQATSSPPHENATVAQHLDYILNQGQNQNQNQDQNHIQSPGAVAAIGNPNIDPRLGSAEHQQAEQQLDQQQEQASAPAQEYPAAAPPPLPPQQPQGTLHVRTQSYTSVRPPSLLSKGTTRGSTQVRNAELAFMMRDYSERAGAWMDLFDLGQYFATQVPVLAAKCPLLLYSCAALSAKSLARVEGRKPIMNGQVTAARRSRIELWPGPPLDAEGWVRKGRENYDLAVSLLRQALAGASRPSTSSLPLDATAEEVKIVQEAALPETDSDELVAATAILCVYEFLDASGPEWSRHLDGAKTLFEVAKDRMVPLTLPPSPVSLSQQIHDHLAGRPSLASRKDRKGPSKGRTAVFWNFARQDMLSAFINNTSTRLDTGDIPMWKSAGLKLTGDGRFLCPSNPEHPDYAAENAMKDDIISNALIWILMKLVNFMAVGDGTPCPWGLGVRQHNLLEQWNELDRELRMWYEGLPDSFKPTAVLPPVNGQGGIEEKWFPRSMCASTMQSYHFARIQLLHNKPHVSTASPMSPRVDGIDPTARLGTPGSSLAARHASYASILQQSRFHAKEIVAIDLGRGDEGTRIHSVQPLWTAGLVLGAGPTSEVGETQVNSDTEMWRRTIVRLLRGIEYDMGWASRYRVDSLLGLWQLPQDWGIEDGLG